MDEPRAGQRLAEAVVALVLINVLRSFGLLGPALVPDAILAAVMALIAWHTRMTLGDLGLRRDDAPNGVRYGIGVLALVLAVLVVGALIPATNAFLHDSRAQISGGRLSYELVVTILLGTAVPEEFAFRGVLLGSALRLWRTWPAVLVSSALFGLWHIAPTLHTMGDNPSVRHTPTVLVVIGAVAATGFAGVIFCWLRIRSGSLVASLIAHFATNGLALLVAWIAVH